MPDAEKTEGRRMGASVRDRHWDAVAAVIASVVGLLALFVAGYTAWIQRQQVRAQVRPYLIGGRNGAKWQLVWVNKGVGPAMVRNVQPSVDGTPQHRFPVVASRNRSTRSHYE